MVFPQIFNQGADLDDLVGVQSDGRLVQDQDGRVADEGLGESDRCR